MGFFFFLLIVGVIIFNLIKTAKAGQQKWQSAAERLGLGYFAGDLGAAGKILGRKGAHRVEISTFVKGSRRAHDGR